MTIQQGDEVIYVQADGEDPINNKTEHKAFVSEVLAKNALNLTVYFHDGIPEVIKKVSSEPNKTPGKNYWKSL